MPLHPVYTIKLARRAGYTGRASSMFARRLLDRVNGVLRKTTLLMCHHSMMHKRRGSER